MKNFLNSKKAVLSLVVLSLYLLILTPLLIINLQKQQELRGKASEITPTNVQNQAGAVCGNVPADIVLIFDRSGSMAGTKITEAKTAAKNFIDVIANSDTGNRIGLVSFANTALLDSSLTNNFASVKGKIDTLIANGNTCHECAIVKANQEIATNGRAGVKKVVVMLTDGKANFIVGGTTQVDLATAEAKALTAVTSGFNASKTVFFTIGFGIEGNTTSKGYNGEFLQKITVLTGGKYYYPAPGELEAVYQEISLLIGKGLLGGFIFNDLNGNGVFDADEPKLNGWNIQLVSPAGTQNYTSDNTGTFTITGVCDGIYTLKQTTQSGWVQTVPSSTNGYSITITNGNSFTDKNFGNKVAPTPTITPSPTPTSIPTPTLTPTVSPTPRPSSTPTPSATPTTIPSSTPTPTINPTPATTFLDLTVYEHGIWNSGDNTNPTQTSLSNKNPLRKTIDADLELFNSENVLIGQGRGEIKYSSASGNFRGIIGIYPNTFTSGKYYLKVKTTYHLKRLATGILTINAGVTNKVPDITLVTGDGNNDNALSILDYNMLLDCYSDLAHAAACNADKKVATDFNDDGFVNQVDYNLFLREIATQPGQ